jgi:hypothetical protein
MKQRSNSVLTSVIKCTTLNHWRSGLLVFSKIVPAMTEKRKSGASAP